MITLKIKLACFNLHLIIYAHLRIVLEFFLIIFVQLFFSSAIHLHDIVRVVPLCPRQRVVRHYIDCVHGPSSLMTVTLRRHCLVPVGFNKKTIVVLINNSPGISGMSLLSAFQTETNFLCQEKR